MARGQLLTMSSLNGSIGGVSFRNAEGGNIMYGKHCGRSTNSPRQTQRKMWVAYYAGLWRTRTVGQRKRWSENNYAGLSGFNLYMYCNLNRSAVNNYPVTNWRQPVSFPQFYNLSFTAVAGGNILTSKIMLPTPATGYIMQFMATPPLSPGTTVPKQSLYKTVSLQSAPTTGLFNIVVGYSAVYGAPPTEAGLKLFIRARLVHAISGYATPWLVASSIVT